MNGGRIVAVVTDPATRNTYTQHELRGVSQLALNKYISINTYGGTCRNCVFEEDKKLILNPGPVY